MAAREGGLVGPICGTSNCGETSEKTLLMMVFVLPGWW